MAAVGTVACAAAAAGALASGAEGRHYSFRRPGSTVRAAESLSAFSAGTQFFKTVAAIGAPEFVYRHRSFSLYRLVFSQRLKINTS